jgi:integrase
VRIARGAVLLAPGTQFFNPFKEKPMSQKNQLLAELIRASRRVGGAHLTIEARDRHLKLLVNHCVVKRFGLRSIDQVSTKHIVSFADDLKASNRSERTVHNILASVRTALRAAGKNLKNMHITENKDLGLSKGDRKGRKEPFPNALLYQLLILLVASDIGLFAAIAFERFLGLRGMEAIRSHQSLATWRRELDANLPLSVTFGTKGKKPRKVFVHPKNVLWLRLAFAAVEELARSGRSRLIDAPTLKKALRRYRYQCEKAGLVGQYAPHSLRYRYSTEILEHLLQQGYSEREALAILGMNLGHGDSRGRWVKMVYARSMMETDRTPIDQGGQEPDDKK